MLMIPYELFLRWIYVLFVFSDCEEVRNLLIWERERESAWDVDSLLIFQIFIHSFLTKKCILRPLFARVRRWLWSALDALECLTPGSIPDWSWWLLRDGEKNACCRRMGNERGAPVWSRWRCCPLLVKEPFLGVGSSPVLLVLYSCPEGGAASCTEMPVFVCGLTIFWNVQTDPTRSGVGIWQCVEGATDYCQKPWLIYERWTWATRIAGCCLFGEEAKIWNWKDRER